MVVLFVSSGNASTNSGISTIVFEQGTSIMRCGVDVQFIPIKGKGLLNYVRAISLIKIKIKNETISVVHAHYGLSGIVSLIAAWKKKPVVISYMGDDLIGGKDYSGKITFKGRVLKYLNTITSKYYSHIIVKSKNLANEIKNSTPSIIPNGVDLEFFDLNEFISHSTNDKNKSEFNLLFLSDPERPEKNFLLLKNSVDKIKKYKINTIVKYNISRENVLQEIKKADIICLPSFHEGSPNVVKEAMALNKVTVTTNVGDVKETFNQCSNLFISEDFSIESYSESILKAIHFIKSGQNANSRDIILEKELDSNNVAKKIIKIYKEVCAE